MTKLALLVCDTPIPSVKVNYGDYHDLFTGFFNASLKVSMGRARVDSFVLDAFDVVDKQEYPDIDEYDGLIITGSAASAYESQEWITKLIVYVKDIAENKPNKKIVGICFGHQIVARALGGECVPNNGQWEVGPTTIELTEVGKRIFGMPTLTLQEMHRDHVPEVPPSFHLLGSTPTCRNQGMVRLLPRAFPEQSSLGAALLRDVQILTVQGHPEFLKGLVSALVNARSSTGVLDEATVKDYKKREEVPTNGYMVGEAVFKMFSG